MSRAEPQSCPELMRTQAHLDSALDPEAAADAARHIATCPFCQAFCADTERLRIAIRHEAPTFAAPDRLRMDILAALKREGRPAPGGARRGFWLGAASGIGVSALAAGLALLLLLPPSAATLTQAIASAHTSALMSGKVIAIASSNHHTVKPWFAGRVQVSPPVADFAAEGFTLAGGRLAKVAGAQAAVVVYRHGKHEIDLFVWADQGSKLPGPGSRHGYHLRFWREGDLDFAAVSDMEAAELDRFVALVRGERE